MTLTINDTTMTSDHTAHTARQTPGSEHLWEVSWLPGRVLDRNSTITAMILADQAGEHDLNERHRLWPIIEELGRRTRPDRIRRGQPASPSPVPAVSSTTGKVNGPTPRRDNDRPAP